jgi:hypothetical protein
MLIEVLGDVGDVEVGISFIGELLQLRVEGFLAVSVDRKIQTGMVPTRAKLTS